ncbi:hypothetical protein, partial [Faecalibacterium duncaniae]|uniref:hypothetical protein n=1 Tax=Faecalibacterium duncaniae (strain DSM 17677 / JCM 31915 / A2-165) TaxID=411483 RepID=UPI002940234C
MNLTDIECRFAVFQIEAGLPLPSGEVALQSNDGEVEESAILFQRNGSQLIVDLAQPLFVQAGMAAAHLGPDRRDGL